MLPALDLKCLKSHTQVIIFFSRDFLGVMLYRKLKVSSAFTEKFK